MVLLVIVPPLYTMFTVPTGEFNPPPCTSATLPDVNVILTSLTFGVS